MGAPKDLESVVTRGLCTGCGLCESLLGKARVEMTISPAGYARPKIKEKIAGDDLSRVLQVCPGATLHGPGKAEAMEPVWGPIQSLNRAWASDPQIRFRSAAGGLLTALGAYLLSSGKVKAVLHVQASSDDPILTDAKISRTPDEVIEGSQSRYGPAAPLTHIQALLDEGIDFAVIAKPCDIAAVRALQKQNEKARRQIKYCLTIFCGGVPTTFTAEKIAHYVGFKRPDLSVFRWRGNGWPGPTRLETKDGRSAELSYDKAWYDPSVPWKYDIQFRCKICPDAVGEMADVAAPDAWVLVDGKPTHAEGEGMNAAIARTTLGKQLIAEAAKAGAITLAEHSLEDLYRTHGDHLIRKLGYPARNLGIRLAGQPTMTMIGFRPIIAMRRAGLAKAFKAFWGGFRRALAKANREPLA